jgi:hypothetical protein
MTETLTFPLLSGHSALITPGPSGLVAIAFIPNPDNLPLVNHIDGDKTNCVVTNLEWTDQSGNHKHAFRTGLRVCPVKGELQPLGKLSKTKVAQILELKGKMPQHKIAEKFGINQSNVSRIFSGERWVGFSPDQSQAS